MIDLSKVATASLEEQLGAAVAADRFNVERGQRSP